jgi:hypothetical protein
LIGRHPTWKDQTMNSPPDIDTLAERIIAAMPRPAH